MSRNVIETIMGGVVLAVALGFLIIAYGSTGAGAVSGYPVTATFGRVDGVSPGTDVRLAGIRVGSVVDTRLDPATYNAVVNMTIRDDVKLPTDSSARILADGLLGGNYIDIEPGAEDAMIADGGEITITQGSVNLLDLVGGYIFGSVDKEGKEPPAQP